MKMNTRLRILVVDDNQLMLETLGRMLTSQDHDVIGLRDPWEASALVEEEKFDGIFLDLTMPRVDGLALTRRIRGSLRNATTPIVIITGRADSAAMKEAFAAGAQFFLAKPIDLTKLQHLVNVTRGSMLREHLRHRQIPLAVEISCRAESGSFTGMTSEVGEEQLVFRLDGSLHPKEMVRVAFRLPTSPCPIEALGEVARIDDGGRASCKITKVDNVAREALRAFVALVRVPEFAAEAAA